MKKITTIFAFVILFTANATFAQEKVGDYKTKFVQGSTNNKIEVLDFGGNGKPILFLSGMGNSAHVFVDFAPKFRDKFHVYAMSRRGFGASEQTANGYGMDTLTNDVLAVTKALNLDKVILIGHSIAGDEISKFTSTYPDKVAKVVYLDAAYDRTHLMKTMSPFYSLFPNPSEKDLSSLENFKAFQKISAGSTMPDEEIKSTTVFSKDGKFLKYVTSDEITGKIFAGIERPNYRNINSSALAIYAVSPSAENLFPFYNTLNEENKKKTQTAFQLLSNIQKEQIRLFKDEVKNGTVKEIQGANHYVFISNPRETEKLVRDFIQ